MPKPARLIRDGGPKKGMQMPMNKLTQTVALLALVGLVIDRGEGEEGKEEPVRRKVVMTA